MDLTQLLETFATSAFRLEGMPSYAVPEEDEAYFNFINKGISPAKFNSEWYDLVRKSIAAGKVMQRLRLVTDPLTEYEQFELEAYKGNIEAGEKICIIDREEWPYRKDFWVFDETWIAYMNYGPDGDFIDTDIHKMTEDDVEELQYWMGIYSAATPIQTLYL